MQKRFNPDEIRTTKISSRLNGLRILSGEHLTGQVGQAGQAEVRGRRTEVGKRQRSEVGGQQLQIKSAIDLKVYQKAYAFPI